MTALLLDYPTTARVRVRPSREHAGVPVAPHRTAPHRSTGPTQRRWSVAQGSSARPAVAPAVASGRLYWTPRGLAVMIALVAIVAVTMVATIVGSFLAVSDAPLVTPAPQAALAQPAAAGLVG
ncbi:hypothetical protein G7070_15365 [Propioniciclava coleopterorum]|uniref:Uncharacterized protein n=1 Tax=Propioniciclava coleopterorum TaxID=2714937 RepID=A0A6G7Y9R5_9ACTN|nr:hypothetical protein [Propioniciclava coleopterorum]QIK73388.1 hypothetical protein G7070_15365 [Propioniciclava coleopterorum]